jgi:protein-S-isoprenylcysteine O-methyltransferase Ste14
MEPLGKPPVPAPLLIAGKLAMFCCWLFPLAGRYGMVATHYHNDIALAAALVFYGAGAVLGAVSFSSLGKSLSVGLPEKATELKTGGAYRISRNPIYLAAFLLCAGSCIVAAHPANYFLFIITVAVHHRIILNEEIFLEGRFGRSYLDYKRRVRRYLGTYSVGRG